MHGHTGRRANVFVSSKAVGTDLMFQRCTHFYAGAADDWAHTESDASQGKLGCAGRTQCTVTWMGLSRIEMITFKVLDYVHMDGCKVIEEYEETVCTRKIRSRIWWVWSKEKMCVLHMNSSHIVMMLWCIGLLAREVPTCWMATCWFEW